MDKRLKNRLDEYLTQSSLNTQHPKDNFDYWRFELFTSKYIVWISENRASWDFAAGFLTYDDALSNAKELKDEFSYILITANAMTIIE